MAALLARRRIEEIARLSRRRLVAALLLALPLVSIAEAQNFGAPLSFTFDWEVTSFAGGSAVSGYVNNNNVWRVTKVRIAVDVLDAAGHTIGRGSGWVVGEIGEGARAPFFVRLPTVGASYRPFVESFDFVSKGKG